MTASFPFTIHRSPFTTVNGKQLMVNGTGGALC